MDYLFTILILFFGTIIGSFLNVVILRLPEEQKLTGRSKCPMCGHELSSWELVPLFSFLFLRGKCRNCHKNISSRYFFIELATALLFTLAWCIYKPGNVFEYVNFVKSLFIITICIVVFVIDLEHFLILDNIIFPSTAVVLILNITLDVISNVSILSYSGIALNSVLAALVAPLPFFAVWYFSKGRWMGFGDVKLMLFLGAALSLPLIWVNLLVAVMLGGLVSAFLLAFGNKSLKSKVPFGTFLAVSCVAVLFFGQNLMDWYLALLSI